MPKIFLLSLCEEPNTFHSFCPSGICSQKDGVCVCLCVSVKHVPKFRMLFFESF
jgi:hypothetical protein